MASAEVIVLTAAIIEYLSGIAMNLYILLVYIGNLRNGFTLSPSDKVLLTKALLNICLNLSMCAENIIFMFWPYMLSKKENFSSVIMILMFFIIYNFWLTALLCVYYCTNITTWGHRVSARLKRSLSSYLLHILLVSGLGSLAICAPIFWFSNTMIAENSTHSMVMRGTFIQDVTYRMISTILGFSLPLTIALVSTMLTSWSLINHLWRMKQNNIRSKFETQIIATRTMTLFILISVIYIVVVVSFFTLPPSVSDALVITIWFVIISYPMSEAVIIIQSSEKFRKTLLGHLSYLIKGTKAVKT